MKVMIASFVTLNACGYGCICSTPAMIPKCSKNKSKGGLSTFDVGIYRFLCLPHVSGIITKGSTELKGKRDGLLKSTNLFRKSIYEIKQFPR